MNRKLLLLPAISLVLLVSGCGGDAKKAKIDSFTASPAIVPTEGGETTLVWDVRNADEIEIAPDIGAVTGTSLTITVTETTTFELIAKRNGHRSHKTTTVTVQAPDMVVGTVRSMINGTPVSGIVVVIDGHDPVITDDEGLFAVPAVSSPYQLTLLEPSQSVFVVYQELTRFDPVIDLPISFAFGGALERQVDLSGVVTGAAVASTITDVTIDNPLFVEQAFGGTTASVSDGTWSGSTFWYDGPTTTTARVHALRYNSSGPVTSYLYGSTTLDIEDGVAQTNVNLTMTSAGVASTTFSYTNADAFQVNNAIGAILLSTPTGTASDEGFLLPGNAVTSTDFDLTITAPDMEGAMLVTSVSYQDNLFGGGAFDIQTVPVGSAGHDVTLRQVPWTLLPVDNGTIEQNAPFAISGPDDAAVIFFFQMQTASDTPLVMVVSADKSVTLPDLKNLGLDYSAVQEIQWFALTIAPRGTIDELAGPGGILGNSPEFIGGTSDATAFFNNVP